MEYEQDYIIIFEAPKIEKPEFRLYYDEKGYVICYTCEKLPGNFIVIDSLTFAESRPDVRVVEGKLIKNISTQVISKLVPKPNGEITCAIDDLSIITNDNNVETQTWDYKLYELE